MENKRQEFLQSFMIGSVAGAFPAADDHISNPAYVHPFELDEITIARLQNGMKAGGKFTARSVTEKYLTRIEQIDRRGPVLKSVIEINPDALAIAESLDKERKQKGPRGPLHGIPLLVKDNIDTSDRM